MPWVPPEEDDRDDLSWEEREALEDPEGPQACDLAGQDDETPTVPCPNCEEPIPDFADRCPYCGEWVVQGGATRSGRGTAFFIIVFLLILALLYWVL